MHLARMIRPAGVLAGLGLGHLALAMMLGLGSATVFSGCGEDVKQSGRVVQEDPVFKQQQSSLEDDMQKYVSERRANAGKRGR